MKSYKHAIIDNVVVCIGVVICVYLFREAGRRRGRGVPSGDGCLSARIRRGAIGCRDVEASVGACATVGGADMYATRIPKSAKKRERTPIDPARCRSAVHLRVVASSTHTRPPQHEGVDGLSHRLTWLSGAAPAVPPSVLASEVAFWRLARQSRGTLEIVKRC